MAAQGQASPLASPSTTTAAAMVGGGQSDPFPWTITLHPTSQETAALICTVADRKHIMVRPTKPSRCNHLFCL
jgi:hypothetical protein